MKEIIEVKMINNEEIAYGIFKLMLQCDASIQDGGPGQFINLYLRDRSMLLPRPISICRMETGLITLVYRTVGKGTKELSAYKAGETLRISTPLGHGYDVEAVFESLDRIPSRQKKIGLVAGGLGVPPMVELAKTIRNRITSESQAEKDSGMNRKTKLIAMLGFQEETFLTGELAQFCDEVHIAAEKVHIAAEKGASGFHGNVLELMEAQGISADYYLSCGPKPMLKALSERCSRENKPLQVSLEERMGCGYGACVGCTCKTRAEGHGGGETIQKKVCKDGPVFYGREVVWDD